MRRMGKMRRWWHIYCTKRRRRQSLYGGRTDKPWPSTACWVSSIIALCCYPNRNSAIRNLSLNTSTAPIFLQFNYFRENIWVIIWVQFHFLYIFVGRVDRIHKTSHTRMLSFYFFASDLQCFGDELNVSSKTAPANIWANKNWSKYLDTSKLRFHNELLHWQKNRFLVFFRAGLHLHVRKISTLSVKQFMFFAKMSYILDR